MNIRKTVRKSLVALSVVFFMVGAHAEDLTSERSNLKIKSTAQILKSNSSIEALSEEQRYDLTHEMNLYNLYMIDQAFNVSDQYIDQTIMTAKRMGDVDFMRVFAEEKIPNDQKKIFNDYIVQERKKNGFDLSSRVNLLVRLDNWIAQQKMKELGVDVPPKPKNFREFDIDSYYNQKFDAYILGVKQVMDYQLDNVERADIINSAGIMSNHSLKKLVQNTPFKKKLRDLIQQEISERKLTDTEKAYIVYWCELLNENARSNAQ